MVVICRGVPAIVIDSNLNACCAGDEESVTSTVKLDTSDGPVGVPEISPVDVFSVSPEGSDPELTDHEYGVVPFEAASVWS